MTDGTVVTQKPKYHCIASEHEGPMQADELRVFYGQLWCSECWYAHSKAGKRWDDLDRFADVPAAEQQPVAFCEDAALSIAERTFSTEVDEQLASDIIQYAQRLHSLYTAPQPVERHPDDAAVDRFAATMKAKLNKKRREGRGGWQSMTAEQLSPLLHEHVRKGDPVDVANLAMMLHQNGQWIEQPPAPDTALVEAFDAGRRAAQAEADGLSAPDVQGEPVEFCEDAALSIAEKTFSTEVDEQLATDIIQYAQRLHSLYAAPKREEQRPASSDKVRAEFEAWANSFKALMMKAWDAALQSSAEAKELRKDKARLDWLADRENTVGNVTLPTEVVSRNLHSLRAAIDDAMAMQVEK